MNKKIVVIAITSIILLLVVFLVLLNTMRPTMPEFNGSIIDPPIQAANFSLINQNGQRESLSDFKGKYLLIFFGFTSCTNECPATMAILNQTRKALGGDADKVRIVFISTDPARDTPSAVKTL